MFVKWQDHVYDFEIMTWNQVSDSGKSNAPLDSLNIFSFPKVTYEIGLQLANWLLRKCLTLQTYGSSWVKGQTLTLTFSPTNLHLLIKTTLITILTIDLFMARSYIGLVCG